MYNNDYNDDYNNDFLSYNGKIGRKNYIINLLILVAIYIVTSLINLEGIKQYITYDFLYTTLFFVIDLFKFIIVIAILSVIYRRISDISNSDKKLLTMFFILFLFPFFYLNWGMYLLNFIPPLINILNVITVFIFLPLALIFSIVLAFIKSKN